MSTLQDVYLKKERKKILLPRFLVIGVTRGIKKIRPTIIIIKTILHLWTLYIKISLMWKICVGNCDTHV